MKCLLDLDGVLVDFVGGMEQAHGREFVSLYKGTEQLAYFMEQSWGITQDEFWEPARTIEFWEHLPWTQDGQQILSALCACFGAENVCILTSGAGEHAAAGKIRWIQREVPQFARRFLLGPDKRFCAHHHSVLVDDWDHNIDSFRKDGGMGLLVPRPWNSKHEYHRIALGYVRESLLDLQMVRRGFGGIE